MSRPGRGESDRRGRIYVWDDPEEGCVPRGVVFTTDRRGRIYAWGDPRRGGIYVWDDPRRGGICVGRPRGGVATYGKRATSKAGAHICTPYG